MATFDGAISFVLRHEGGFVQDEADPGGATKWGLSLRTLRALEDEEWDLDHDGDVDAEDVRRIDIGQAVAFYREQFWMRPLDDVADQRIATKIFDIAVNAGRRQAVLTAQRAAAWFSQILVDGVLGPDTVEAINACDATRLYRAMQAEQAKFYVSLVNAKRTREGFLLGWLNRAFD